MILTCPECATSYFVDDSKIPEAGRAVKCASCGARWTAQAGAAELDLEVSGEEGAVGREPAVDTPDPDDIPISALPGEVLPKVFRAKADTERRVREAAATGIIWAGLAAALLVLLAVAFVFRVDVVRLWPRTASAYAFVGQPVNSLGLVIEGVRFEPSLQEGHAALSVSGMIRNIQDEPVISPPMRISLLDEDGKAVVTKIARPADAKIPPGETRHFAIALLDPPTTARVLEVAFAPPEPVKKVKVVQGDPPKAAHAAPALRTAAEPPAVTQNLAPAPVEAQPLPPGSPDALPAHD
ncbi:DUF3426 domain-containing protein [Phenylobacterium sp.]|uniref:DUF3426 domain-containing protein n=1 Tax=Phenylobacterium sp. TaxID=1871053 RepID=UPI00286A5C82|nr:DUF3426 domain-containing protein [Phenylobacterium sp.]